MTKSTIMIFPPCSSFLMFDPPSPYISLFPASSLPSLQGTDVDMYKLYIYASKGLVITYEREIMPDLEKRASHLHSAMAPMPDNVCSALFAKYEKIYAQACAMGPMYILYNLGIQALAMQNSILEYFSRALFYFKQTVHTRLHHREKLRITRKMHIVSMSVLLLQKHCFQTCETFKRILHATGDVGGNSGGSIAGKNDGYVASCLFKHGWLVFD